MRRTFRYRAIVNKTTKANALRWLELCRNLYNTALEQRIFIFKHSGESLSFYDQCKQVPELKETFPEFKTMDAQCLQDVLDRVDKAFKGFFRRVRSKDGKAGFPRFKSPNRYRSFTLRQNSWRFEGRNLYIRNVGRFKLFLSRPIEGTIKVITIKQMPTGKWFVLFSCDNVFKEILPRTGQSIGIDLGIRNYIVTSEGEIIDNPRYFQNAEKALAYRQRRLQRRNNGSNRRNKARKLVAKCHEKIANQRRDFLFKTALDLIKKYDTIYIESLDLQDLFSNKFVSKKIADASWYTFLQILHAKAEEAGRVVIEVPPGNTSLLCSNCGKIKTRGKRSPTYICQCGFRLDRDHNAAINILRAGQVLQGEVGISASMN